MLWLLTGTRPDIIKLAPVCVELDRRGVEYAWIHSGQHYDKSMADAFFDLVSSRTPDAILPECYQSDPAAKISYIQLGLSLIQSKCTMLIVLGDTLTTLAGALFANSRNVPIVHIESGLRSGDIRTPEELIRITVDGLSTALFTTCSEASLHLYFELPHKSDNIHRVGNTLVDSIQMIRPNLDLPLCSDDYILLTVHRTENLANVAGLKKLFDVLAQVRVIGVKVIFPVHPHTKNVLKDAEMLDYLNPFEVIGPQDFSAFMLLEMGAKAIVTDSGSVQEEAYLHGVPCVVVRSTTERPETVDVGAATLVDLAAIDPAKLSAVIERALHVQPTWDRTVYGDGSAAAKIVGILKDSYGVRSTETDSAAAVDADCAARRGH